MAHPRVVRVVPVLATVLVLLTPALAGAQTAGTAPPVDRTQIISANPFGLIIEWFNVEYQRRITPTTTVGASVSWFSPGDDEFAYASGNAIVRYYPSASALSGFFLGGRGGAYRFSDAVDSGVFFGAGFEIGYDWLLGSRRNIGLSLSVGATRIFGSGLEGVPAVIPNVRLLNVGIAF